VKRRTSAGFSSWTGLGVQLFSDYELEMIHDATLEVLEKSGIFFESDLALDIFERWMMIISAGLKQLSLL
jgi:trimethylamine--corrinoid protein Co-methyltransferase